jgi:response regulator RpfG family c-di-GMP phosphodiesterase
MIQTKVLVDHPLDTGTSPWSGEPLVIKDAWKYFRGELQVVSFAADPVGVLFLRTRGWLMADDTRAMKEIVDRIVVEMQWENRLWMIIDDCSQLDGMDLSARSMYVDYVYSQESLRGIVFSSPKPLIKAMVRIGMSFKRTAIRMTIAPGWQDGCNTIGEWFADDTAGINLPIITAATESEQKETPLSDVDKILYALGELDWARQGEELPALQGISKAWLPFLNMISIIKKDIDNLMVIRNQRLSELSECNVREETLQRQMTSALIDSQRSHEIVEKEAQRNITLSRLIVDTQKETLFALSEIIETRSRETANHIRRVAEYSALLGKLHGLNDREQQYILHASPMHDAGKIAIPDAILNKPGKLTDEEFEQMKEHSIIGWNMLHGGKQEIMAHAAIIAYQHHEKWNGWGYPNKLSGESIHLYGRIVALADVFDALGSDRCYKKAWPLEKVLDLIHKESGEHFDPSLVEVFFNNLSEFLVIRERYPDALS